MTKIPEGGGRQDVSVQKRTQVHFLCERITQAVQLWTDEW